MQGSKHFQLYITLGRLIAFIHLTIIICKGVSRIYGQGGPGIFPNRQLKFKAVPPSGALKIKRGPPLGDLEN